MYLQNLDRDIGRHIAAGAYETPDSEARSSANRPCPQADHGEEGVTPPKDEVIAKYYWTVGGSD